VGSTDSTQAEGCIQTLTRLDPDDTCFANLRYLSKIAAIDPLAHAIKETDVFQERPQVLTIGGAQVILRI
jgi:hypothetical protein